MKKLISCLLALVMLLGVTGAFADSAIQLEDIVKNNEVLKFLKETDLQTKDIALQFQAGDNVIDLVIRADGDTLHLVARDGEKVEGHLQLNPTGLFVTSGDTVKLLRYDTVMTFIQDIAKGINEMLEEAIKNTPQEQAPSEAEIKNAVNQMSALAAAAEAQEQADAVTISSAAMAFAGKFKPENILDVKQDGGSVTISLRSEAFASALADAMDELMMNPALAEVVDREAALKGGTTFVEAQKEWLENREETLNAIRSIQSTETVGENGHMVSHFQIGEEFSATKILMVDTDSWIDENNGELETAVSVGFKNEDPLMVHQLVVNPYAYWEKLTAGNSWGEVQLDFDNNQIRGGKVLTVIEDKEELRADFGTDYFYIKGPKGGLSTSVRETWTGKTRYEVIGESADGKETSLTLDFYEDGDSLISEMKTSESEQSIMYKITRVDKLDIADLAASENIDEITVERLNAELETLLKLMAPAAKTEAPADK